MGGDDDGRRGADAGLLQHVEIRRVAAHDRGAADLEVWLLVHDDAGKFAPGETPGHGDAHAAGAEDDGGLLLFRHAVGLAHQAVEGFELLFGAGDDQHGRVGKDRVQAGQGEDATLPDADDVDAGVVAQGALQERLAGEGRAHDGRLADADAPKAAEHAEAVAGLDDAPCQGFAEQAVEVEAARAAGHAQDVPGRQLGHTRHDGELGGRLAGREDDVAAAHVRIEHHELGRLVRLQAAVGFGIVVPAKHDPEALFDEGQRLLGVVADENWLDAHAAEVERQIERDGIGAGNEHVPSRLRRKRSRHALLLLPLQPGLVDVLDEGEWQEHHEVEHAEEQDQNGKSPAEIRCEGDVAEAEGRHDRERPVQARQPGVLLAFVEHDEVEDDTEDRERQDEDGHVAPHERLVLSGRALGHEGHEQLEGEEFHHAWDAPERGGRPPPWRKLCPACHIRPYGP